MNQTSASAGLIHQSGKLSAQVKPKIGAEQVG